MTNLSVRESVIYSREGRRAGIRDFRASAFGQMDRKICLGLYKAGRNGMFAALCLRLAVSETCVLLSFCFSFLSAKRFQPDEKMRFRHVLSPFSSCFWLRQKPQAFQSAENFFSFGCERKIAFSRKNRIYAIHCCIYAVWMYFYSITPFFSGL